MKKNVSQTFIGDFRKRSLMNGYRHFDFQSKVSMT